MFVAANTLGDVVDWTATVDERQVPLSIGFFVELANDEGMSYSSYPRYVSLVILTLSV